MTTTTAPADTWTLAGITSGEATCDHCGRTLARCFRVVAPNGDDMTVGRVCSAKLTGYKWAVAAAERAERLRIAEETATERYGDLYAALTAQAAAEAARFQVATFAGQARTILRDPQRRGWDMDEAAAVAYARDMLARSIAQVGRAA
jgi:hypothetical protein